MKIYDIIAIGVIAFLRGIAFVILVIFYPKAVANGFKEFVKYGIKKIKKT